MQSAWPAIVRNGARFSTSQIITSPPRAGKPPAAASSLPSGENATARTSSASPGSVATILPVSGSTSRTSLNVPSASSFPSNRNASALMSGFTAVRGLIFGIAAAPFAHHLARSRRLRPSIDPLADNLDFAVRQLLAIQRHGRRHRARDPQIQKALTALPRHDHRPAMATLLTPRERIQIEGAHGDIARMAASTVRREDGCHILRKGRRLIRTNRHCEIEQDTPRDGNNTSHSRILQAAPI